MKVINKINHDLIEIIEFAKPNACFQTNEYPDDYDFIVLREIFNPFDLFNDNKIKEIKIERLNNIIKEAREYIESYIPNYDFDKTNLIKLLEILDKEKYGKN